jgi:hypothetical protein
MISLTKPSNGGKIAAGMSSITRADGPDSRASHATDPDRSVPRSNAMIRTVPETTREGIELYIRTYYSLLRSSGDIRIRSLEETHEGTKSSLHLGAESSDFDVSAFLYAALRLPDCLDRVQRIVMGQSDEVFVHAGMTDIAAWQRVDARARRRRMLFDGDRTLAAFIASVSDIDDLLPTLTAFQIEWNKLHRGLAASQVGHDMADGSLRADGAGDEALLKALGIDPEDLARLRQVWRDNWNDKMQALAQHPMDLRINSLARGFNDYRRAAEAWWDDLVAAVRPLCVECQPVYFVSSNPHSLPNLLSGYPLSHRAELVEYVLDADPEELADEWRRLSAADDPGAQANFLYYTARAFAARDPGWQKAWVEAEAACGILRFDEPSSLDITAQVIQLSELDPACLDPRLQSDGLEALRASRAVIVNVDYPLGFAAYHLLSQISSSTDLVGNYVMGKAATLSGRVGDVMIPNVVYDEHSRNTYLFKNCFLADDVAPYLRYGTVFDNQKTVTVRGTFLQNRDFMSVFYREGYTDLEMEAGPYLSAIYEDIYPQRYPFNEIVNLFINAPYDIGLLHYASDTPYSRRQSLLSKSLSYFGMDATYACGVAIARRILRAEVQGRG